MRLVHADRGEYYYSSEEFGKMDLIIQIEIIRLILKNFRDSVKDITEQHYKMVISLSKKEAGKQVCLPGNICVERRYEYVRFKNQIADVVVPTKEKCELPYEGVVEIRRERMRLCMDVVEREKLPEEIPQKDYTKWFNYDNIKSGIELRNPEEGDFFVMDKQGNKKKLSRYYIDEKIPLSERKREIVLADGSHVLWAVPGRMSDAYKITEDTKKVLVVVLTKF